MSDDNRRRRGRFRQRLTLPLSRLTIAPIGGGGGGGSDPDPADEFGEELGGDPVEPDYIAPPPGDPVEPPDPDPPDDPDPDPPDPDPPDPPEPDPDFGTEILSIDASASRVEATVEVTVSDTDIASYEIDINDSATAKRDTVDSVVTPGDPDTIVFDFDPEGETEGTITATFLSPSGAVGTQDQVDWSYDPVDSGAVEITNCGVDSPVEIGESADVSFDLSNDNPVGVDVDWEVSVDGSRALTGTKFVRANGNVPDGGSIPPSALSPLENSVDIEITDVRSS